MPRGQEAASTSSSELCRALWRCLAQRGIPQPIRASPNPSGLPLLFHPQLGNTSQSPGAGCWKGIKNSLQSGGRGSMVYEETGSAALSPRLVIRKRKIKPRRKDAFGFPPAPAGRMLPAAIKIPWRSRVMAHNHEPQWQISHCSHRAEMPRPTSSTAPPNTQNWGEKAQKMNKK